MTCISGYDDVSYDSGKAESHFVCNGAIRFAHIGMFTVLHGECINQRKSIRNKRNLNSILKGRFLVFKYFDESYELQTTAKKSLQFYMFLALDFCNI